MHGQPPFGVGDGGGQREEPCRGPARGAAHHRVVRSKPAPSSANPSSLTEVSVTVVQTGPEEVRAAKEVCGWVLRRAPGQVRTVSGATPTPWLGVVRGRTAAWSRGSRATRTGGRAGCPGPTGRSCRRNAWDGQGAVLAEGVEQGLDGGDGAAAGPAEGAEGGVGEEGLARPYAQVAQGGGEGGAGVEGAGHRRG